MSDPVFKPRLPMMARDGDKVITISGNIYEYNAEENQWVCTGIVPDPEIVSSSQDGLVTPDIYRKLSLIQELIERGFDFSAFKLNTDVDNTPYFYYFHSSDDLIKFSHEKVVEPKQVLARPTVAQVVSNGDGTTTVLLTNSFTTDFSGLTLETNFGNYKILSSNGNSLILEEESVNILGGDFVKVVKDETMVARLRVEVDKGRLYQKLVRNCCVGPKGAKGDKGDKGTDGAAASKEVFQVPSVNGLEFSWDVAVETPIDTSISLRVYRNISSTSIALEILHPLDNSAPTIIINDPSIDIEQSAFESFYEPTSGRFSGSFSVLTGGDDIKSWRFKVRQRGAKGPAGSDGKAFLEIANHLLGDASIRSIDAILSIRKAAASDDIIIFRNSLFDEIPVSNLSATSNGKVDNIEKDFLVSVAPTIEEAKSIGFYQFTPQTYAAPDLDIPLWTPTADCVQARRWSQYRFDWFNRTDPTYMFSIIETPRPPEQCCQEDFFFCPNIGDAPCGIQGEVEAPIPLPADCACECVNPIASELTGGGLVFDPIDLTDPVNSTENQMLIGSENLDIDIVGSGGSDNLLALDDIKANAINTAESVIDGITNNFTQDIKLVGNGEVIVVLDYDSDPCGGAKEERESCAFVDSCAVRSLMTLTDRSGTAVISSGGMLETTTIPTSVAFTIQGQSRTVPNTPVDSGASNKDCVFSIGSDVLLTNGGEPGQVVSISDSTQFDIADLQLKVAVNTSKVNYCRGYRITIITASDQTSIEIPGETVVTVGETGIPLEGSESGVVPPSSSETGGGTIPDPPHGSFAADGTIITGGTITNINRTIENLTSLSNYALTFNIGQLTVSGTGANNIFIGLPGIDIGNLVQVTNNQVSLTFDALQNNTLLEVLGARLSKIDAGYDQAGPWGVGTYVLGFNFTTNWYSRIPNILVRRDTWGDAIGFFNEPQNGGPYKFFMIGRLKSSNFIDSADSMFATELFESGIDDGIIVVEATLNGDPMVAIEDGSIIFAESGQIGLFYIDEGLNLIYPTIGIGSVGSDPSQSSSEPAPGESSEPPGASGLDNVVATPTNDAAGAVVDYTFTYDALSTLPINGQIWIDFDSSYDISLASVVTSSSYDGTFSVVIDGQTAKISRNGDGTSAPPGSYDILIGPITNPTLATFYEFQVSTRTSSDTIIDGPATSNAVEITAGFPLDANCTVVATPTSGVMADAIDTSSIVVTLFDMFGNPVSGETVVLTSSIPTNALFSPSSAVTNSSGVANFTFASTLAGPQTVSATVTSSIGTLTDTEVVTFSTPIISALSVIPSSTVSSFFPTTYTISFSTNFSVAIGGRFWGRWDLGDPTNDTTPTALSVMTWTGVDGTITGLRVGQEMFGTRNGDGAIIGPGAHTITVTNCINDETPGTLVGVGAHIQYFNPTFGWQTIAQAASGFFTT